MSDLIKIGLDARELAHPKPFEKAIKILQILDKNSYLYMLNKKEPHPLINFAQEKNFNVLTKEDKNNNWHILISHKLDIDLNNYLLKEDFNV